jgi:hypothetical protein
MKHTVEAAKEYGVGMNVNGTGKRPLIRGFFVMRGDRRVRAFAQSSGQKWTPELETKLRDQANAWAAKLDEMWDRGQI